MKDNQELIEKYIIGELSEEEVKNLGDKMRLDAELKQEIELIDNLQADIQFEHQHQSKETRLQQRISQLEGDYFTESPETKVIPLKKNRKWLLVASLLLLLSIPVFIGKTFFNKEHLVAANYVKPSSSNRTASEEWKALSLDANSPQYLFHQYQLSDFLYQRKELEQLQQTYKILLDNQQNIKYNRKEINFELVQWNSLLVNMLLNEANTEEEINTLLQSDISNKYKEKARQLRQKRKNLLYQLFD